MKKLLKKYKKQTEKGYALLEYSAGAAIVATVLWLAMTNLGNGVGNMLNSIGTWAQGQATVIDGNLNGQ